MCQYLLKSHHGINKKKNKNPYHSAKDNASAAKECFILFLKYKYDTPREKVLGEWGGGGVI